MRVLQTREVQRVTPRSCVVRLDLGNAPLTFAAGQAIIVGLPASAVRSAYSISSSPRQSAQSNMIELLVQIDETGAPDPHLERLQPGEFVEVEGPFGSFGLPLNMEEHDILLVAGGTGIAPLRSMMWDAIDRDPSKHIALIYSARSPDEFAYRKELEQLAAEGRIDFRRTVTREDREGWLGPRGRINTKLIQSVLRTTQTRCALCGPPTMIADVARLLRRAGVEDEKILMETFAA